MKYLCAPSKAAGPIGGVLDPSQLVAPLQALEARENQVSRQDFEESTEDWAARVPEMTEDTFDCNNFTGLTALNESWQAAAAEGGDYEAEIVQAATRLKKEVEQSQKLQARAMALEETLRVARACQADLGKLDTHSASQLREICRRVGQLNLEGGREEDAMNLTPSKRARRGDGGVSSSALQG